MVYYKRVSFVPYFFHNVIIGPLQYQKIYEYVKLMKSGDLWQKAQMAKLFSGLGYE